jgi:hypothetical protein
MSPLKMVPEMKKVITITLAFVLTLASLLTLTLPGKVPSKNIAVPGNYLEMQSSTNAVPTSAPNAITNSSQPQKPTSQQESQHSQPAITEKTAQFPSTFTIVATIVSLVAVFGTILSLCLRRRNKGQTKFSSNAHGERFWAIDCYGIL